MDAFANFRELIAPTSTFPTNYLRDRHPALQQLWPATTLNTVSDHTPNVSTLQGYTYTQSPKTPCVPLWIAKHPEFGVILHDILQHKAPRATPKLQHAANKEALYQAAQEFRNNFKNSDHITTASKLALAVQAARAAITGNERQLSNAFQGHPDLQQYFDHYTLTQPQQLHEHIQALANTTLDEKLQELDAQQQSNARNSLVTQAQDHYEQALQRYRANLIRWGQQFRSKNKTVTVSNITRQDGTYYPTPEDEVLAATEHWQPTFSPTSAQQHHMDQLLSFVERLSLDAGWVLTFPKFLEIILSTGNTAQGQMGSVTLLGEPRPEHFMRIFISFVCKVSLMKKTFSHSISIMRMLDSFQNTSPTRR